MTRSTVVIGGGIAGLAAATVLAEHGARVTLLEREGHLGGRAASWPETLATGDTVHMERGFHGFFRQYYNLRRLLRRVDPALSALTPATDYPILGPDGQSESFTGLPRRAPWNVAALAWRSPALRARDLLGIKLGPTLAMLRFDMEATYRRWDGTSARDYLDSLGFPPAARRMLFDVFAHSFFCAEEEMSAGELLMMFHYYFLGNREGLVFDLAARPMSLAFWQPLGDRLAALGAAVRTCADVTRISRAAAVDRPGAPRWRVHLEGDHAPLQADSLVLALSVPALRALVARSPDLASAPAAADPATPGRAPVTPGRAAATWAEQVAALPVTRPFAVLRLWLDRPVAPDRAPFAGTTGIGRLDNISVYDHFQDQSRAFAAARGGSVVELHAYAVEPGSDENALRAELLAGLHALYPETRRAAVLDQRWLWRQDCSGFPPGAQPRRPGVATPHPGLALAGDFVALPVPSALMERAATSGIMAANTLLTGSWQRPEPVESLPPRGLLAPRITSRITPHLRRRSSSAKDHVHASR